MDKIVRNYVAAPKDFNLSRQEVERRQKLYEQNVSERNSLQRTYDGFFVKKPKP